MKEKVSVYIITFNEENIIGKCLEKLSWADEIVVIDSGSTDKTVEICEKFKAKVIYNKFINYGTQKQFALNNTKNNWVLNLDADEILSDNLIAEIKQMNFDVNGYFLLFKHVFLGKIFNYGNESNRLILRFFNKQFAKYNELGVHEYIEIEGNTNKLSNELLHYSYFSVEQYIDKLNKYTSLYAAQSEKNYHIVTIATKTIFEFFKKYFLNKNILNGKEGFYWSVFSAFYMFTKLVKRNQVSSKSL